MRFICVLLFLLIHLIAHSQEKPRLIAFYAGWDQRAELPCCISGADWSESEKKLYYVSDLHDKIFRCELLIEPYHGGYRAVINNHESLNLHGIRDGNNLEAIRIMSDHSVYLSAEFGYLNLQTFLYKGKINPKSSEVLLEEIALPSVLHGRYRTNAGIEALSISEPTADMWVILEEPFADRDSWPIASVELSANTLKKHLQYPVDLQNPAMAVAECLQLDASHLLTLERHYSLVEKTVFASLYLVEMHNNDRVTKSEYLSLNSLPIDHVDNFEAMCFGPKLPNGNKSLILISDNNENAHGNQRTDLLVFELPEK